MLLSENICKLFSVRQDQTCTSSVTNQNVVSPNYRLEFARNSYGFRGPMYWNLLDKSTKEVSSCQAGYYQ